MKLDQARLHASALSREEQCDVFLYNGPIERDHDFQFLRKVQQDDTAKRVVFFLITRGGDPDAGYKISRFLQDTYDHITLSLPGVCKSAGTLLAMGAHELRFGTYGELGPIDIQAYKTDNLVELQSGLNISEAIETLTDIAVRKHGNMFGAIMAATSGIVSFPTAAHATSDLINGLFGPIFSRIDPYEVGEKARAMRIAQDYGKRLAAVSPNARPATLNTLARTYPSHSFVIDRREAEALFNVVGPLSAKEEAIVKSLEEAACDELKRKDPLIECLARWKDNGGGQAKVGGRKRGSRANSKRATGKAVLPAAAKGRRGTR